MPTEIERFSTAARRGGLFDGDGPIIVARAPGWVDLIGGAAAAGGALALGWPVGGGTFVALQPTRQPALFIHDGVSPGLPLPLAELTHGDGSPREYADAAGRLAHLPWPQRLAAGAWLALMREEFVRFPGGARMLLRLADVPGSAAGLVAAVAQALVSAFRIHMAPRELALAVQTALARLGAVNQGALGPAVTVCAHSGSLLPVHQQPAWLWEGLHMPHGAAVWALRLGDGPAPSQRLGAATAIAYALAAEALGLSRAEADAHWLGYVANLGTPLFEARVRGRLPETVLGAEAIERLGQPAGAALEPDRVYPVRAAAALAVEEHLRARMAAALLRAAASKAQRDEDLHLVGEIMARSHGSQRAAGLGDAHADALVQQISAEGAAGGLYGARLAAAESGASLVVLGRAEAEPALREIAGRYERAAGVPVTVFAGSSAGASAAGTREV